MSCSLSILALLLLLGGPAGLPSHEEATVSGPAVPLVDLSPAWSLPPPQAPGVYTLLNYFDAGQARAETYLREEWSPERFRTSVADWGRASVRVEILLGADSSGQRGEVMASGVLVDGGRRVLTAGHSFDSGEPASVWVVLPDGLRVEARLVRRPSHGDAALDDDWALLEVAVPDGRRLASRPVARPQPGSLGLILGYPDRIGLDREGRAFQAFGGEALPLDPLLFVVQVGGVTDELVPLAGSIPLGGASGSPVLNERGEVVGVLTAIGRLGYPDGVRHSFRMTPAEKFVPALTR